MIRLCVPSIDRQERQSVAAVLKSGFLVQGKAVAAFEKSLSRYLGVPYAVAVSSGTSALHLALLALGIGPGDEVIVPDYTFPATANTVALTGARPVVVDVQTNTFNINPDLIEAAITKKTRAIMPVHLFGQSADMAPVMRIAQKHRLAVIEDAACVLGATYQGRACGTIGDVGCFSFHPRKVITTGEGGLIVTRSKSTAGRLRLLRNHGMVYGPKAIDFIASGFNYRMTEIQAAMGLAQMKKLRAMMASRRQAAARYAKELSNIDWLKIPEVSRGNTHVYQAYIIQVSGSIDRDALIRYLHTHGIEANIGTYALHRLTYFKEKYRLKAGHFPATEAVFKTTVALPLFQGLNKVQIQKIAGVIKKFNEKHIRRRLRV